MTEYTLSSFHRAGQTAKRCCEDVWERSGWPRKNQCSRQRGYGPEEAYCKQHDPAAAKAREYASKARWDSEMAKKRIEWAGPKFLNALKQIAAGHNDPASLARDVIDGF